MPETIDLNATVFAKTAVGQEEIQSRTLGLSLLVRRALVLVDGKRSGAELSVFLVGKGDVEMVLAWLHQAAAELGGQTLRQHAQTLLQGSAALPPLLETAVSDIPDGPGVYLFYGEGALPLVMVLGAIGRQAGIQQRAAQHQAQHHRRYLAQLPVTFIGMFGQVGLPVVAVLAGIQHRCTGPGHGGADGALLRAPAGTGAGIASYL